MAVMSRDQVLAHIAAGRHQTFNFAKIGTATPEAVGAWTTAYLDTGTPGAATAPTTTWANATDLAGSVFHTNVSPQKRYLWSVVAGATQNGTLFIYDRLGHIQLAVGALAAAGNKTITTSALPRSMDSNDLANVEAWFEVTTATATAAPSVTMNSYTNEAGSSGRAGAAMPLPAAVTNVGWMGKLPLQAGDKGIQAISTVSVTTGGCTAGTGNVFLARPLAYIPIQANISTIVELPDLPRVYDGSSIFFAFLPATSAAVFNVWGKTVCVYDS